MLRPIRFASLRSTLPSQLAHISRHPQRRLISFAPPSQKPRSFKGSLARWALAGGALYWYATRDGDVFTDDARARLGAAQPPIIIETHDESEQLPTIEAIHAARRERQAAMMAQGPIAPVSESASPPMALTAEAIEKTAPLAPPAPTSALAELGSPEAAAASSSSSSSSASAVAASPAGLEEEAESEGAFNEETGEINWDCPCLGGMAHGPCGEQFREAFSCFVFSKEEPKGVDCIERFKTMQDCFREHPDVYGEELRDEPPEDDLDGVPGPADAAPALQQQSSTEATPMSTEHSANVRSVSSDKAEPRNPPAQINDISKVNESESQKTKPQPSEAQSGAIATETREGDEIISKATYDARDGK